MHNYISMFKSNYYTIYGYLNSQTYFCMKPTVARWFARYPINV